MHSSETPSHFGCTSTVSIGHHRQFGKCVLFLASAAWDWLYVDLYRVTPTVRMDFRFFDSLTFVASGGVEKTLMDRRCKKIRRCGRFFFFGLQWDFS